MNVNERPSDTRLILEKSLCVTRWSQRDEDVTRRLLTRRHSAGCAEWDSILKTEITAGQRRTSSQGPMRLAAKAVDPSASPLLSWAAGAPGGGARHSCSWPGRAHPRTCPPATSRDLPRPPARDVTDIAVLAPREKEHGKDVPCSMKKKCAVKLRNRGVIFPKQLGLASKPGATPGRAPSRILSTCDF